MFFISYLNTFREEMSFLDWNESISDSSPFLSFDKVECFATIYILQMSKMSFSLFMPYLLNGNRASECSKIVYLQVEMSTM